MTLPPSSVRAIQATTTNEVFLILLSVFYDDGSEAHIVSNTENITSRGVVYTAWPFALVLPNQLETTTSSAELQFDNIDPVMWNALRQVLGIPRARIDIVLASAPDTVLLSVGNLKLRGAQATATMVTVELFVDAIWQLGYPANDYLPAEYPGLFSGS